MISERVIQIAGEYKSWYEIINYMSYWLAFLFLAIWNIIKRKELDPEVNCVWITAKAIGILSAFFFAANWINQISGDWFMEGHKNYFGTMYTSIIMLIPAALVFLSVPMKRLDYYTPCLAFILAIFKLACHCAGCCYGK